MANSATAKKKTTTKSKTASGRPEYTESKEVTAARKDLKAWENEKPGEYDSKYSEKIDSLLNEVLEREKFDYNMDLDPLYQQYKDSYIENGKKAMMDTVGEASALTGGYASSYAVTAGNEAYDEYLNALNDTALELRDRAYEAYEDEGNALFEDISLLRSLDGDEYQKFRDVISDYYKDGDYLSDKLTAMSDAEYEAFLSEVEAWESDRDYNYKLSKDKQAQANFKEEMAFKEADAKRDQANADRNYALQKAKAASSGSSSSSSTKKAKIKIDDDSIFPKTYQQFVRRTSFSGILTAAEFSARPEYQKAYGDYVNYLEKMYKRYGG